MDTANTVRIDPTKHSGTELRVVGDRVSRLWNASNYRCRQRFIAKEGVPTGSRLQELMQPLQARQPGLEKGALHAGQAQKAFGRVSQGLTQQAVRLAGGELSHSHH